MSVWLITILVSLLTQSNGGLRVLISRLSSPGKCSEGD